MEKFLLMFTTKTCAPCKEAKKLIKENSNGNGHHIKIYEMDTDGMDGDDKVLKFANQLGVRSVPSFFIVGAPKELKDDNFSKIKVESSLVGFEQKSFWKWIKENKFSF